MTDYVNGWRRYWPAAQNAMTPTIRGVLFRLNHEHVWLLNNSIPETPRLDDSLAHDLEHMPKLLMAKALPNQIFCARCGKDPDFLDLGVGEN